MGVPEGRGGREVAAVFWNDSLPPDSSPKHMNVTEFKRKKYTKKVLILWRGVVDGGGARGGGVGRLDKVTRDLNE